VLVSLDGLEETHDMSRGRAVRFAQVEETIRRLSGMRKRGVRVSVNHTIASRRSLLEAEALRARFAPLGVDVQPVLAYSSSATYGLSLQGKVAEHLLPRDGYPLHPALDREEALSFVRRTLGDLSFLRDAPTRFAKRYYLRGLAARLSGVRDACPRPRCVALRSHLRLLPDGSVPLCQFNGQRIGRMPSQPFEELWGSEVAAVARAWVDGCRGCWAECEVVPNALYSGDLLLSSIGRRGAGQRERPLRLRQGRRT
jgi:MoaA/NifB/PqqE/SkfB family radical SAM enzyme